MLLKEKTEVLRQSALDAFSLHVFLNSVSNVHLIVHETKGTVIPLFI